MTNVTNVEKLENFILNAGDFNYLVNQTPRYCTSTIRVTNPDSKFKEIVTNLNLAQLDSEMIKTFEEKVLEICALNETCAVKKVRGKHLVNSFYGCMLAEDEEKSDSILTKDTYEKMHSIIESFREEIHLDDLRMKIERAIGELFPLCIITFVELDHTTLGVVATNLYDADSYDKGIGTALYNVLNAHDVLFDDLWRTNMPASMIDKMIPKEEEKEEEAKENVEC